MKPLSCRASLRTRKEQYNRPITLNTMEDQTQTQTQTPKESRPPPRYRKGELVAHSSNPRQALHIYNEPYWSSSHGQWMYDYDYNLGLTSEGSALQGSLIPAPKNSVL